MNQVFVCSSYFHLYVSILTIIHAKDKNAKSLIIINDHIPDMDKVIPALIENNFFDYHLSVPFSTIARKKVSKFINVLKRRTLLIDRVDAETDILKYEDFIRLAEINVFNNQGPVHTYFLLKFKKSYIRLIEDGVGNYLSLIGKFRAFKRRYVLNSVIGAGHDDQVKEILVQYPEKVIDRLKAKAKKLSLKEMQESLRPEDKSRIVWIFMRGLEMNLTSKKKLLLITQPLSEDKYISENQKVTLYNQAVEPFAKEFNIFLKPHPREKTDYTGKINYTFTLIPQGFPLEMFDFLEEVHFELGITVSSSSLHNLTCVDRKIILGREYFEKPLPANWYEAYRN